MSAIDDIENTIVQWKFGGYGQAVKILDRVALESRINELEQMYDFKIAQHIYSQVLAEYIDNQLAELRSQLAELAGDVRAQRLTHTKDTTHNKEKEEK